MNLDLLDPIRHDDPAFDPDGPQAQRVLIASRHQEAPRKSRRRPALALAAVAAAAVAAVAVSGTTSPTDARAALLQAAERTARIDSGRVIWTLRADGPSGYRADVRNEIRFSGDDLELRGTGTETLPSGAVTTRDLTFRLVDGIGYQRSEGGEFEVLGPVDESGGLQITQQVDNENLVALVRNAADVTRDGDTYSGTVTAGEYEDAAPTAPGRATGPAWDRPITLTLTLEAGLIRRIVARGEHETRTTEYLDLGTPQVIVRP